MQPLPSGIVGKRIRLFVHTSTHRAASRELRQKFLGPFPR
jgi:hypothetical protein